MERGNDMKKQPMSFGRGFSEYSEHSETWEMDGEKVNDFGWMRSIMRTFHLELEGTHVAPLSPQENPSRRIFLKKEKGLSPREDKKQKQ